METYTDTLGGLSYFLDQV